MNSLKSIPLIIAGIYAMSFTVIKKDPVKIGSTNYPTAVKWKADTLNLGEIPFNKPDTIEFEFTNTGKDAMIIVNVTPSCGCTHAQFPQQPILPGKSGKISAIYNAANKGSFYKTITVQIQNEKENKVLVFRGTVV
ncbi:DUF1573 domain-containing protein [Ferruginibacter albus]|uniref:DUF1573 domain-containing protein n=1 Tax=Ferruginibacter albus TaxID=2875540 RepID=UPI001CC4A316|nr:DUF1573 domain-containing protein [Ferruginibacter albus]UAY53539.1 DUF1573 domain-containing protein [Ferruginibacter albus]